MQLQGANGSSLCEAKEIQQRERPDRLQLVLSVAGAQHLHQNRKCVRIVDRKCRVALQRVILKPGFAPNLSWKFNRKRHRPQVRLSIRVNRGRCIRKADSGRIDAGLREDALRQLLEQRLIRESSRKVEDLEGSAGADALGVCASAQRAVLCCRVLRLHLENAPHYFSCVEVLIGVFVLEVDHCVHPISDRRFLARIRSAVSLPSENQSRMGASVARASSAFPAEFSICASEVAARSSNDFVCCLLA